MTAVFTANGFVNLRIFNLRIVNLRAVNLNVVNLNVDEDFDLRSPALFLQQGDYALGKALWSPKRDRSGGDVYWAMRQVQPGDVVIHLVDQGNIAGVSIASGYPDIHFQGLPNTALAKLLGVSETVVRRMLDP